MATLNIEKGKTIIQAGEPFQNLFLIVRGNVEIHMPCFSLILTRGDIIGLLDLTCQEYSHSYIALEDCVLASYSTSGPTDIMQLLHMQKDLGPFLLNSALKNAMEIMDNYILSQFNCSNIYSYLLERNAEYKQLCTHLNVSPKTLPRLEEIESFSLEEEQPPWLSGYYEALHDMPANHKTPLIESPQFLCGFLAKLSEDLHHVLESTRLIEEYQSDVAHVFLNEDRLDFFDLFTGLYFKVYTLGEDTMPLGSLISKLMIQIEGTPSIDQEFYKERLREYREKLSLLENTSLEDLQKGLISDTAAVENSLQQILDYGECSIEIADGFKKNLQIYKNMADKNIQDNDARKIRTELTGLFYKIYTEVFMVSIKDPHIPPVIRMFLNFGYVDEELAGAENSAYLYKIAETYAGDSSKGVYTLYEWLTAIYEGKKSPSRNEFDVDYEAHLRELRVNNKISPTEEKVLLSNNSRKVLFELENMFPIVNKITFGRLSSFCPLLSEHNILKDMESSLVTPKRLDETLFQIRSTDYSAFFRDTLYTNPACNIAKEFVAVEILPDIILMPNVGTRGVMWQEIEGKKRTTPARFMISTVAFENITNTLIRLTGEYRWEMCKRIQGARWNDLSDRSLTSEYFDYMQFYRKNNDLSSDAKEKIKNALPKAKNSFKEMFVQDYTTWILYEANGSPRLNKVARGIIFTYCPFAKDVRTRLMANPLYRDPIDKYTLKTSQKLHHLGNVLQKLKNSNIEAPAELLSQLQFLNS